MPTVDELFKVLYRLRNEGQGDKTILLEGPEEFSTWNGKTSDFMNKSIILECD